MIKNKSTVANKSKINQRPITASYVFSSRQNNPITTKKRVDRVSLFQSTAMCWKKDKFLTAGGNVK